MRGTTDRARLATDPPGLLTVRGDGAATGAAAQTTTLRWEDYTQTAMDPVDDLHGVGVGDYLKAGAASYSTRVGAVGARLRRALTSHRPLPPTAFARNAGMGTLEPEPAVRESQVR